MVFLVSEEPAGQRLARESDEISHLWLRGGVLGVSFLLRSNINMSCRRLCPVSSIICVLLPDFHRVVITCCLKRRFFHVGKIHTIPAEVVGFSISLNLNKFISISMFAGLLPWVFSTLKGFSRNWWRWLFSDASSDRWSIRSRYKLCQWCRSLCTQELWSHRSVDIVVSRSTIDLSDWVHAHSPFWLRNMHLCLFPVDVYVNWSTFLDKFISYSKWELVVFLLSCCWTAVWMSSSCTIKKQRRRQQVPQWWIKRKAPLAIKWSINCRISPCSFLCLSFQSRKKKRAREINNFDESERISNRCVQREILFTLSNWIRKGMWSNSSAVVFFRSQGKQCAERNTAEKNMSTQSMSAMHCTV